MGKLQINNNPVSWTGTPLNYQKTEFMHIEITKKELDVLLPGELMDMINNEQIKVINDTQRINEWLKRQNDKQREAKNLAT